MHFSSLERKSHSLSMANMQIPIWLRGESGHYLSICKLILFVNVFLLIDRRCQQSSLKVIQILNEFLHILGLFRWFFCLLLRLCLFFWLNLLYLILFSLRTQKQFDMFIKGLLDHSPIEKWELFLKCGQIFHNVEIVSFLLQLFLSGIYIFGHSLFNLLFGANYSGSTFFIKDFRVNYLLTGDGLQVINSSF